jgi:cardiolipin synthase (CMP-forming)
MPNRILTTANQLTLLRMIFIPIFVVLLVYDMPGWAFLVFILAGITDGLDGLIARLFQQKTQLGAYLDPLADKLLLTTSFVALSTKTLGLPITIPLWLTIFVLSRDIVLVASALMIALSTNHRRFRPSIYGKATTFMQILTVLVVLYFNWMNMSHPLLRWVFIGTGAITIFSGLHYIYQGRKLVLDAPNSVS